MFTLGREIVSDIESEIVFEILSAIVFEIVFEMVSDSIVFDRSIVLDGS